MRLDKGIEQLDTILSRALDKLHNQIDKLGNQMEKLDNRMEKFDTTMRRGLDKLDNGIDKLGNGIEQLDITVRRGIYKLDRTMTLLEDNAWTLAEHVAPLPGKIKILQGRIDHMTPSRKVHERALKAESAAKDDFLKYGSPVWYMVSHAPL